MTRSRIPTFRNIVGFDSKMILGRVRTESVYKYQMSRVPCSVVMLKIVSISLTFRKT